jgi:hypothetical protein
MQINEDIEVCNKVLPEDKKHQFVAANLAIFYFKSGYQELLYFMVRVIGDSVEGSRFHPRHAMEYIK